VEERGLGVDLSKREGCRRKDHREGKHTRINQREVRVLGEGNREYIPRRRRRESSRGNALKERRLEQARRSSSLILDL